MAEFETVPCPEGILPLLDKFEAMQATLEALKDEIMTLAEPTLKLYLALQGIPRAIHYIEPIEVCGRYVSFEGEEYWSYGGYENHFVSLPIDFFYPQAQQKAIDAYYAKKNQKVDVDLQRRLNTYLELKKEFEDGGSEVAAEPSS